MKGVFQAIEAMKRDGVIDEYAVAGAVGAIFYTEAFSTRDIDFLVIYQSRRVLWTSLGRFIRGSEERDMR